MKKIALFLILLPISALMVFLTCAVVLEFKPGKNQPAELIVSNSANNISDRIKILTWNIGYGGLGKNADFFMDGGVSSRPSKKKEVEENLNGIVFILHEVDADILMIQEVDKNSTRTFKIDESAILSEVYQNFESWYAVNFRVFFVPSPILNPIGTVDSGLLTVSGFSSEKSAERISLPVDNSLPLRFFNLKRCMLVLRYKIDKTEKDFVLINIHLSAYENETLKAEQLDLVKKFIVDEYSKGNSVVVGGDWNHILPGIKKGTFGKYTTDEQYLGWAAEMPENWTPTGWKWAFDKKIPTVRNNESAYTPGKNFVTVIDGFLVSPDINIESIFTINTGFEYSDHQPVVINISF